MNRILITLLTMIASQPAYASDPYWAECDHIETVTGMDDWKPNIKVGSLGDLDGKNYILLQGWLEAPTSGYSYQMNMGDVENGVQTLSLKLLPPKGMAGSAISKVAISERFENMQPLQNIVINIEKSFNWGPDVIHCSF